MCEVSGSVTSPAAEDLFVIQGSPPLDNAGGELFYSLVAKLIYLAKRVQPDLLVSVSLLATHVLCATEQDNRKLHRTLKFLCGTANFGLTLEVSDVISVLGYVDASYGAHVDGKSRTGANITLGQGAICAKSCKQKVVSKSSTEAELTGLSDSASQIISARDIFIGQGHQLDAAIVYQGNMSAIALVEKGRSKIKAYQNALFLYQG